MSEVNLFNKKLKDMKPEEREHMDKQLDEHLAIANKLLLESVNSANNTEQNLSAQLILISTVIFTGSLLGISNAELYDKLTDPHKALLLTVCTLQVISIISGIKNYRIIEKFMITSAEHFATRGQIIIKKSYTTYGELKKMLKEHDNKVANKASTPKRYINIQMYSIGISLILFCGLLYGILFNAHAHFDTVTKFVFDFLY